MVEIMTDADADADSNSTSTPPNCPVGMAARGVSPDVLQEWPGLPRGVKFDPSDEELLGHLIAKIGKGEPKPHPLISEFITSLDEDDRFGYTHPQTLAGVKQDGSASFFFHRRFKEGARKDKMIRNSDSGVVWWHMIGKTVPVIVDGVHQGCKKMMNLYLDVNEGDQAEKTNWVMFQYYLGRGGESEEEFVVSKIFHQRNSEAVSMEANAATNPTSRKRKIRAKDNHVDLNTLKSSSQAAANHSRGDATHTHAECEELDNNDIHRKEDPQGGQIELLDYQQHVESITTNEDLCQDQSSCSIGAERRESQTSDDAPIGVKHWKNEPRKRRKEVAPQKGCEVTHSHAEYGEASLRDSHSKQDKKCGDELLKLQQDVEGMCRTKSSCSAEAERSVSCMSDDALTGVGILGDDSIELQNGKASIRYNNKDANVDYGSEFMTDKVFKSREAMIKWTRDQGRMYGFVIVIKKSYMSGSGRKPKVSFGCERGGKYGDRCGTRNRDTTKKEIRKRTKTSITKKCECPFSLTGKKLDTEDDWMLLVDCGVHNHPATDQIKHSFAGRLTEEENALVIDMFNRSMRPRDILAALKQRDPLNSAINKTIYNALQKYKHMQQVSVGSQVQHENYQSKSVSLSGT